MTDQPRDEVNRYAQLDPTAQALVDDHDQIALAEMLVKAQVECDRLTAELGDYDERAEQQKQRADRAEAAITRVRDLAGHILRALDGPDAEQPARTTPDNPPTSENTPDNPLEEQLRAAIESEMYEYRERTMWWPEGAITGEIARLATRGALEALGRQSAPPAWTPPPPGSTAEQLPETLLALIRDRLPDYTSTACQTADTLACAACYPGSGVPRPQYDEIREHAERLHSRCRLNNKFTGQLCVCGCHPEEQQPYPPAALTNQENQS